MSGIEIAGLVLGAFPIVIEGLEKYREIARRVGFWYRIRSEHQRSLNELKFHRLIFERNLDQLLFPLVASEGQLQDLIAKPGGPGWNDPAIQHALEKKLQDSYPLYLEIMDEMQKTIQKLNKELSVDNPQIQFYTRNNKDQPASPQSSASSRFRKSLSQSNLELQLFRVKFSLGESTRTRLFLELQTCNDRLEKLTLTSDSVAELQAGHRISTATSIRSAALCKFWNNADRLYKAIMGAWGCTCYEQHCAELVLQHRQPPDNDFLLHFCPGQQEGSNAETGSWSGCSVRLHMREQKATKTSNLLSPQATASNITISLSTPQIQSQQPPRTTFSRERKTEKVQLLPRGTIHSVSQSSTSVLAITPAQQPPSAAENIVDNLCRTLGATIKPQSFIESHDDIRYYLTSEKRLATHSSICLSDILSCAAKPLTRRQRYHLSMTIASSFVQLKDTPWLQTPWGKDGVHFSRAEDQHTLLLDSPFIVQFFTSRSLATSPGARHDVASIASLGILLLELCFGKSIDQHPNRLKYAPSDEQTKAAVDLVTALDWLKDVNDEAGADYSEAVEWCLSGCRTMPSNGAWRKLMVEKVVLPLERCFHYLS